MVKAKQDYNASDIITYEGLEAVRKKIAMYAGSADNESIIHAIVEIISNSIDEHLAGYGNVIDLHLNTKTNTISIRDFGRGIPPEKLEEVFTKLHSSGKFIKEGNSYGATGGTHGIGLSISTALGAVEVQIFRNRKKYTQQFTYNSKTDQLIESTKEEDGTLIFWTPDPEAIKDTVEIFPSKIQEKLLNFAYPTPGLEFRFTIDEKPVKIYKANKLSDFLYDYVGEENFHSPIMQFNVSNDFIAIDCAMVWGNQSIEKAYLNLIPNPEGGSHVTTLRTALTREFNKIFNEEIKGEELRKGLSYILSVKTLLEPQFSSQAKLKVAMQSLNAPMSQLISPELQVLLQSNEKFFIELIKIIKKARERENTNTQIRSLLAKSKVSGIKSSKLKPAINTKGAELFITEGNSASGSLTNQRDPYIHAIMSLRGKIINFKKHEMNKVLENEEVQNLILTMGGWGEKYDGSQSPYNKVVIATDQDDDGVHLRLLLTSFFFEFYPEIIRQGKLYFLDSPLYTIKTLTSTEYTFSEKEMEKRLKQGLPKNSSYTRAKGLGELSPKVLGEFAFGKNRRLKQIKIEDEKYIAQQLELFLGKDGAERSEIIKENVS